MAFIAICHRVIAICLAIANGNDATANGIAIAMTRHCHRVIAMRHCQMTHCRVMAMTRHCHRVIAIAMPFAVASFASLAMTHCNDAMAMTQ